MHIHVYTHAHTRRTQQTQTNNQQQQTTGKKQQIVSNSHQMPKQQTINKTNNKY